MIKKLKESHIISMVLAIVLAGTVLRFINLGTFAFWIDELYHVFSAKSILDTGSYFVPFKGEYTRAFPTTWIAAGVIKLFGETELVGRIPFVLFNMTFVLTSFFLLRKLFSTTIAFFACFVFAFSPFEIELARQCRMYAPFQLFFFVGTVFFLLGFEGKESKKDKWGLRVPYLAASVIMMGISFLFHRLTVNFAFVLGVYALVMIIFMGMTKGWGSAFKSKYALLMGLEVLGFIGIFFLAPEYIDKLVTEAREIPDNFVYLNPGGQIHYYRYFLTDHYPVFFFLFPIGAFFLIKNYGRQGLLFVLSFVVLYIIHSFWFERRASRYIFYAFPYFIISAIAFIDAVGPSIVNTVKQQLKGQKWWVYACFAFVLVPTIYVFCHPWAQEGLKFVRSETYPNWKEISDTRRDLISKGTVIAGNPNEFTYYLDRQPDYYFMADYKPEIHTYEPGRVEEFEELKAAIDQNDDALVVTTRFTYANEANFTKEMRAYIEKNMDPIENTSDTEILVFKKKEKRAS